MRAPEKLARTMRKQTPRIRREKSWRAVSVKLFFSCFSWAVSHRNARNPRKQRKRRANTRLSIFLHSIIAQKESPVKLEFLLIVLCPVQNAIGVPIIFAGCRSGEIEFRRVALAGFLLTRNAGNNGEFDRHRHHAIRQTPRIRRIVSRRGCDATL